MELLSLASFIFEVGAARVRVADIDGEKSQNRRLASGVAWKSVTGALPLSTRKVLISLRP